MSQDPKSRPATVSAGEALKAVRSGHRVLVGSGCAAPQELLRALVARGPELSDVELVHLLTFGIAPYVEPEHQGAFRHNAFFIGKNVRESVNDGRGDFTPIFLSEIPDLFRSGQMRLDVVLCMVSPPDRFGYVSLGIHPDIMLAGIEAAHVVIAQVNHHMPRVHGDTFVHISRIKHLVEHDEPLQELPSVPMDDVSMAIARHIAPMIGHGATLQLGIGTIPNAVLTLLRSHHDLGLHTEMFSDGAIDLFERGVITNNRKGFHEGKAVSSFAMGSKRLYDYLDDNPNFDFQQTSYVNDPRVIAQNQRMVSINSAIQVDITGQVCADSIGPRFFSGIGGQVDFIRGAAMSKGGKPFIALPSTARKGTVSRIVPTLDEGAGVVTSRGDAHYVVTEHGVAYLHGRSVRDRAMQLIEIAHPDFRSELRAKAVDRKLVPVEWHPPTESDRYPVDMEERVDFGGETLLVRPLRSSDADRLMEFFYSHSPETVYGRYRHAKRSMPREEAIRLCTLDYKRRFALGVFDPRGHDDHLVAVGRYRLNERTGMAEPLLVIHDDHRRRGIGVYLMNQLRKYAQDNGVLGFEHEFDPHDQNVVRFFQKLGFPLTFDPDSTVYRFSFRFEAPHVGGGDGGTSSVKGEGNAE